MSKRKKTVKQLLDERGMTTTQLAKKLKMSEPMILNRLDGYRKWKVEEIAKLCAVLGVELTDIKFT